MTNIKPGHNLLRSIPLFANAFDETIAAVAAASSLREFPARAVLVAEGAAVEDLYTVVNGAVELLSERDERRLTLCIARSNQPILVCSILAGQSPASARILEPSRLMITPAKLILDLIRRDSSLAEDVLRDLSDKWLQMIECFKSHRLLTSSERIADWILNADASSGSTGEVVIPFDKRVLASYLGMAPEQLSRHFAALASVGVEVRGRHITLVDRKALAAITEGAMFN